MTSSQIRNGWMVGALRGFRRSPRRARLAGVVALTRRPSLPGLPSLPDRADARRGSFRNKPLTNDTNETFDLPFTFQHRV